MTKHNTTPAASASRHMPEPWKLKQHGIAGDDYGNGVVFSFGGAHRFVEIEGVGILENVAMNIPKLEADGRRIVSCVNALAGLNPEAVKPCLEKLQYACDYPLAMAQNSGFRQEVHAALAALKGSK